MPIIVRDMNDLIRRLLSDIEDGTSRRRIADRIGVSEGTIRNLLDGKKVKVDVYERLADGYLRLPREEVFRMAGVLPPMYTDGHINRTWLLSKLWDVLTRLPEEDQALVLSEAIKLSKKYPPSDEQTET